MIDFRQKLCGKRIEVRPLHEADFESLYQVASDAELWAQHPAKNRYQKDHFEQHFFKPAMASGSAYVVVDSTSQQIIGSSRFYDISPDKHSVAIGYTFIGRDYWGSGTNKELKALMIDYVSAWAEEIWFHVAKQNLRSRKAVEKLGAKLIKEEPSNVDGVSFIRLHYCLKL